MILIEIMKAERRMMMEKKTKNNEAKQQQTTTSYNTKQTDKENISPTAKTIEKPFTDKHINHKW